MEESWFEILKRYREESGVSLQELSLRTRIGVRHIQALEAGDLTLLSSPAFIRGFIRSLCAELRKDPSPIVLALNQFLAPPVQEPEGTETENGGRSYIVPLVVSGAVLLVLIAGAFLFHPNRTAPEAPAPSVEADSGSPASTIVPFEGESPMALAPVTKEGSTGPSAASGQLGTTVSTALPASPDLYLTITAVERTWLRYTPDNALPMEATLSPGESIQVKAASTISLFIGNAGGILFDLNGKTFGPPGEPGQVISNYVISRANL